MFIKKFMPVVLTFMLAMSCSDQDKQSVKRDIDTMKNNVSRSIDTVKEKLLPGDTIFKNVVMKEVTVSDNVSKNLHNNLGDVFDHYLAIKDELADNDSIDSRKHAYEMLDVVMKASEDLDNQIDKKWTLTEDKLLQYRKVIENAVTLDQQREWFSKLTASLTEAVQKYGIPGKTIYELNSVEPNKSRKWLTDSKNSDDPYTGDNDRGSTVVVLRGWEFN